MTYFLDYNPLVSYSLISIILAVVIFILPLLVAPLNYDNEKLSAYECGFNPFETARITFDIQYYLIAILFIIFDIEIIFFFPWVLCLKVIGFFGYFIGLIFLICLIIGFYYEWIKGGLDWKLIFPFAIVGHEMINYNFIILSFCLFLIIQILLCIAFFTLLERKIMAKMQRRKGPDVVGFWGLLQPLADGVKLLFKEIIFPRQSNIFIFILGPLITFILSLFQWIVIPINLISFFNINLSFLYTFALSSLSVYGLIMSGWASNSKYAFLGSLRATAQMISYELSLGFIMLIIVFINSSFNYTTIILNQIAIWNCIPLFPLFIIFLIIMLAETNRTPFDLAEAEAELVAGYNVEFSSIMFALFFLGEYSNMLIMSILCVIFFLGGGFIFFFYSNFFFILKVIFLCFFFIWVRATLPRYRYDQLMNLGWKIILPFTFGWFIFIIGISISFNLYTHDVSIPFLNQNFIFNYIISRMNYNFLLNFNIVSTSYLYMDLYMDAYYTTFNFDIDHKF